MHKIFHCLRIQYSIFPLLVALAMATATIKFEKLTRTVDKEEWCLICRLHRDCNLGSSLTNLANVLKFPSRGKKYWSRSWLLSRQQVTTLGKDFSSPTICEKSDVNWKTKDPVLIPITSARFLSSMTIFWKISILVPFRPWNLDIGRWGWTALALTIEIIGF